MFDYTRNMQLALTDRLRRAGLMAGAGAVLLIAAGFLLAALWTWLAWHLHWGPLYASLAIGGGFLVIGLVMAGMAGKPRHRTPTTDELKAEIEQKLNLAADVAVAKVSDAADLAMDRASQKAGHLMEAAEQRVHSLAEGLSYRADRFADRTEARVYGAARKVGENASRRLGLAPDTIERAVDDASQSRAAPFVPLIGAFALGITLASRLRRRGDDASQDWPPQDWDERDL